MLQFSCFYIQPTCLVYIYIFCTDKYNTPIFIRSSIHLSKTLSELGKDRSEKPSCNSFTVAICCDQAMGKLWRMCTGSSTGDLQKISRTARHQMFSCEKKPLVMRGKLGRARATGNMPSLCAYSELCELLICSIFAQQCLLDIIDACLCLRTSHL